jgi:hypothetical protein
MYIVPYSPNGKRKIRDPFQGQNRQFADSRDDSTRTMNVDKLHAIKMTTFAFIFKANFIRPRYFVHVGL